MADMVLNVRALPEILFSKILTEKVRMQEDNGSIILTPVTERRQDFDILFGMFSDGRISTEEYFKEKQSEKKLED
jgi:hypothetical protein